MNIQRAIVASICAGALGALMIAASADVPVHVGQQISPASAQGRIDADYWNMGGMALSLPAGPEYNWIMVGTEKGDWERRWAHTAHPPGCSFVAPGMPREWCLYQRSQAWALRHAK